MSDNKEKLTPESEGRRRPGTDWRLQAETESQDTQMIQIGKVLGWVGLLALVVALLWFAVTKAFNAGPIAATVLGLACVAFWVVTNLQVIVTSFKVRGARNLVNSLAFVLFVLGILVMVNIIGARHHWRHDLTKDKTYSLSDQTLKIIQGLDKDVQLVAFLSPDPQSNSREIEDRVREYSIQSRHIKLEQYDPQLNVQKVQEYNVRFPDTIIVKCGDKKEEVAGGSEEQLTSAILSVTEGKKTKIYFLSGHGEKSIDGQGKDALTTLKASLANEQYDVQTLTLATQAEPAIPQDCACLVVVGPKQKLLPKEKEAVKKYVDQGGRMFIALDPGNGEKFEDILGPRDVTPLNGIVIDPQGSYFGQAAIPTVIQPKSHKITEGLQMVALPLTIAFDVKQQAPPPAYPGAPPPPASKAVSLLDSTASAFLTQATSGKVQKQPTDKVGPLSMAVAIDEAGDKPPTPPGMPDQPPPDQGPKTRIVVMGSSRAITDEMIQAGLQGNVVLALSSIAWVTENNKLISIPPKDKQDKKMTMTDPQRKVVIIITLLIVPGGLLVAWALVWWTRRRR